MGNINVTKPQIAAAFTEWERRFREEPEKFQKDFERLAGSAENYGENAAAFFIELLGLPTD